jgi:cobalt-zinc-cadmium efflux system outer membrane protein
MDIIDCAVELNPNVLRRKLRSDSYKSLVEKAKQIPNPVLTTRSVKGDKDGVDIAESETSLSFKVEIGGKRGARVDLAKSQLKEADVHQIKEQVNAKILTVIKLNRLRQMIEEKKSINEAILAFNKVIKKLKRLPRLSAEQEASMILFEISVEETKIQISEIFEEEREIEHFFHVSTGHSLTEILKYLPKSISLWPSFNHDHGNTDKSFEIKRLKVREEIALNQLSIEKSRAWPDLKIGPSIQVEQEGGANNTLVGFNLSLPLPLFSLNGGGKANARSNLIKARKLTLLTAKEEKHERHEQLKVYESSLSVLKTTMNKKIVDKKYDRIQKLYLRGVVSSTVLLESLRQKISFLKLRHNKEMTTLKSLWSIYMYDGKVLEVKL